MSSANIGPVMLDLNGLVVGDDEITLLQHTATGGVILFSRNYESPEQIQELIAQIRRLNPSLLVAVDQEGGRVQRFRQGLSRLPALGKIGELYQYDPVLAIDIARQSAWLMAAEMIALGVDLSFAPVLDLNYGRSEVIGDRSFSHSANESTMLAAAYISGMRQAGMASTGKHFPGHGYVVGDSHTAIPRDNRCFADIDKKDLQPYRELFNHGLDAIMPAHVIYSECDENPAGFSQYWLQDVLRRNMKFKGVIFSDDLTMEGASVAGDFQARARAAIAAGCDMVLVCNDRQGAEKVLDASPSISNESCLRLIGLRAQTKDESVTNWRQFKQSKCRRVARESIATALGIDV